MTNSNTYSSDNPDKSIECYPCMCPSCNGYHECAFTRKKMKHGDIASCNVCGTKAQFIPLTEEDIERIVSFRTDPVKREEMRQHMLTNIDKSGTYKIIIPASR